MQERFIELAPGEEVRIGPIRIKHLHPRRRTGGNRVSLGVDAPREMQVLRGEHLEPPEVKVAERVEERYEEP